MAHSKIEPTHWEYIGEPALYRYRGQTAGQVEMPVLMIDLSDTSPGLWDLLGVFLMREGFRHIYVCKLPGKHSMLTLMRIIERVLGAAHAPWLILMAEGWAAAHALHYVEEQKGYNKVHMLVGLNGQYQRNALSYLEGSLLQRDAGIEPQPPNASLGSPKVVNQFVMLNINGQAPTSYLNPDRSVLPLPEAVNVELNLHPKQVMRSPKTYDILRPYLQGKVWLIQLHLHSFQMRTGAPDADVGRFFFEVNRRRVPPEGVFAPPDQKRYEFENFTPLGTVALAAKPGLQAANISLRLREIGRAAPEKRALMTTLHVPLVSGQASDHHMQDSFGSEIRLRVHCVRAPRIIPADGTQ